MENNYTIATGPSGNGDFFENFKKSTLCKKWARKKIKYLSISAFRTCRKTRHSRRNPLTQVCNRISYGSSGIKQLEDNYTIANYVYLHKDLIQYGKENDAEHLIAECSSGNMNNKVGEMLEKIFDIEHVYQCKKTNLFANTRILRKNCLK